jgi:hypothetical protein
MPVTILDAWAQEDDYGQNGAITITGSNTRLQTRGFALGFDGGSTGAAIPVLQTMYKRMRNR